MRHDDAQLIIEASPASLVSGLVKSSKAPGLLKCRFANAIVGREARQVAFISPAVVVKIDADAVGARGTIDGVSRWRLSLPLQAHAACALC